MSESDVSMPMDVLSNKAKVMKIWFPTYHTISIDSPVYLNVLDRVGHKTSKSTSARGYVPLLFSGICPPTFCLGIISAFR